MLRVKEEASSPADRAHHEWEEPTWDMFDEPQFEHSKHPQAPKPPAHESPVHRPFEVPEWPEPFHGSEPHHTPQESSHVQPVISRKRRRKLR